MNRMLADQAAVKVELGGGVRGLGIAAMGIATLVIKVKEHHHDAMQFEGGLCCELIGAFLGYE